MAAALLWLIIGVLLVAAEVLSGEFVLLMLGVAALAAAGVSALDAPLWLELGVFAITSVALTTVARPMLKRRLQLGAGSVTGTDALVGSKAVVVEAVTAHSGTVKLRGEIWTARPLDDTEQLEPGRSVTIMDIKGATAVVLGES